MTDIIGKQFINGMRSAESGKMFASYDASTGTPLPYTFYQATDSEIENAAEAAAKAFPLYKKTAPEERAVFLETIATELDALDDGFIQVVIKETGLPEARVRGERLRTSNQMRLFAAVVRRGDFLGARIDTALPERQPLPRPDIRQYHSGLGPVAVFGAANFPLAFSVAGGDTASALAAGCPVVVKAHPGHPATSELVGAAIVRAVNRCALPPGVFGMVFGGLIGGPLVKHPAIKAVGFTGSLSGGRALRELATQRPEPIPVFAEMSSINPLVIMPGALAERGEEIAAGLAGSVTLGVGQFCTKPGLVLGIESEAFERFCQRLVELLGEKEPGVMLNQGILKNYQDGISRLSRLPGVRQIAARIAESDRAYPAVFSANADLLHAAGQPLEEEVFGPATVLVALKNQQELLAALQRLHGSLTASLFADFSELSTCRELISVLEAKAGRIILNDYPTGVEVCDAMVHGGPYPATFDCRATSVGSRAIERFLRPCCYQGYPDALLPAALQNANPLGLRRLVNGMWTDAPQ